MSPADSPIPSALSEHPPETGFSGPRPGLVLAFLCIAQFMVFLDGM